MHSAEVTSFLRLSDISGQIFIFVTKDVSSDSNFIYSEILPYYVKNNYGVVLLNFAQSFAHYNHLLLKCGVNIRQLRESLDFVIIDGLCEIGKLADSDTCATNENSVFSSLFSDSLGHNCIKQLYNCIKNHVQNFINKSKPFVLLLDDINVLFNLGLDLKAIYSFVQYCRSICTDSQVANNVLLIGSTHERNDEENVKMVNYLLHLADIKIQIEGLKTGYSKDAHGKITLSIRNQIEGTTRCEKMLFKISEKGAKLLTLGL